MYKDAAITRLGKGSMKGFLEVTYKGEIAYVGTLYEAVKVAQHLIESEDFEVLDF